MRKTKENRGEIHEYDKEKHRNTLALYPVCSDQLLCGPGRRHLGVWNNEEKDAKIEIFRCSEKYCGKIVWAKEPNYPARSTEGTPGTPRLDHHNPDAAKRYRPIFGLQIMNDFIFAGKNVWKGGTVYRSRMTPISPDTLALRGFVGIPLFGRSTTWT